MIARRLVERGVRCVQLYSGGSHNDNNWDAHGDLEKNHTHHAGATDQPVAALLTDLKRRGLLDSTLVVWGGEFGRTPVISPVAGRDHWPRVSAAVLAGGGMKTGQVIGATDRLAGEATSRPVKFAEVFATLYHNLGIDTRTATITDLNGRPQYLVADHAQPLAELVG